MQRSRELFAPRNDKVIDSYRDGLARIRTIATESAARADQGELAGYYRFFQLVGQRVLAMAELEETADDAAGGQETFEELQQRNESFYSEIDPANYGQSFANPTHAIQVFGDGTGQLMSLFYIRFRQYVNHAVTNKIFLMEKYNRVLIEAYDQVTSGGPDRDALRDIITRPEREADVDEAEVRIRQMISPETSYFSDLIESDDLSDLRYLFKLACHVTEHDIRLAKFMQQCAEERIRQLSLLIANAFVRGFERDGKDLAIKSTVRVYFRVGQERLIRQLVRDLREHGLEAILSEIHSTPTNRQYWYDHRFDLALYLDPAYVSMRQQVYTEAFERVGDVAKQFSGNVVLDSFGEPAFAPEPKPECLTLSSEQQGLYRQLQMQQMQIHQRFLPRGETSFSIVAFPTPEIGDRFEEIFEDTVSINLLDPDLYGRIQQKMIDALDLADHVHVLGSGDNQTDIRVKLQTLADPAKQSNFVNCGADVNIPVGEVYTSPQLTGTSGVLHVSQTYLRGLRYENLKLTFTDGYVTDYECANFDSAEENRKFIEENLLFPHSTLPIGEFAIGTNTLAHVVAQKYDILSILPVLITEKMGPHFAVGDTCFAHEEDSPVVNSLTGKEIIARENEKSAQRRTAPDQAYTGTHTDITLPYESLGSIAAVQADGTRVEIIKDGRFVLAGTEELNQPLDSH